MTHYSMLQSAKSSEELEALSLSGQDLLLAMEKSTKPVVAGIMGSCLGGGLEVQQHLI